MFPSHTAVKVSNPDHARAGQAGHTVGAPDADQRDASGLKAKTPADLVRFDIDGATEVVASADLQPLA